MEGVTLFQQVTAEMDAAQEDLDAMCSCVDETRGLQASVASADRDYKVAKLEATLEERRKGTPVTVIENIVRGDGKVSEAALKRDCAQAELDANKEAIAYYREAVQLHKKRADLLNDEIKREYGHDAY